MLGRQQASTRPPPREGPRHLRSEVRGQGGKDVPDDSLTEQESHQLEILQSGSESGFRPLVW